MAGQVYTDTENIGQDVASMLMARFVPPFALVFVLLASPAAAQRAVLVEGLSDLSRAMMMLSENRAEVNAAIDKMAAGLDGWGARAAPSADDSLLGDEAAALPVLPLAAYGDGFARLRRGEYRDAIVSLRRAAATATDERSQLAAAALLAQEGRHLEAERALRSIVTAWPESGVAHWWLGRVYENINRIADARQEYETVVPVALTGRASIQASIGRLAFLEGNFARATEAFEQRLRLTPNDPVAHEDLATIYLAQDRTEAALEQLGTVVTMDPRDAEAHAAIGRIRLDAGLHAEAIVALRRALDLRPTLHEARYALALALKRTGREDEAAREMELFERARREATEDRRRTMTAEAQRQEEARQDDAARQDQPR
jgi:tetratricopeptide (TPR) repeat protein